MISVDTSQFPGTGFERRWWVERLGDQAATEIPVWERPCRLGFLLTGDPAQAEDLAQEALVRTRLATPLLTRGAVGGS